MFGDGAGIAISTDEGVTLSLALNPPTDEELEVFTAMLESLDAPSDTDSVIEELILEQAKSCLAGEKKQWRMRVRKLRKRVSLYLAE